MRQPLWILNSVIFLLVIAALIFMIFSRVTVEEREALEPVYRPPVTDKVSKINIKEIFRHDIFNTYKAEIPQVVKPTYVKPLPSPPKPARMEAPKVRKPSFLDPLDVSLKGIMSISNGIGSSAVIQDNKTKRESNYKVGDMIEDAQLIRIFNNKVIFVRSNGQQEVFYLSEEDAQSDPTFLNIDDWTGIVKKYAKNSYTISPSAFLQRIKNLAQFIDLLNLTSAYRKGESVGCRIGDLKEDSLGMRLGLKKGDLILSINKIRTTTTPNRIKIYKNIISLKDGDTIVVRLQRGRSIFVLTYKLQEFAIPKKQVESKISGKPVISTKGIRAEQEKLLEQKYKMNPTVGKIRNLERRNMFQRGANPRKKMKKNKFVE